MADHGGEEYLSEEEQQEQRILEGLRKWRVRQDRIEEILEMIVLGELTLDEVEQQITWFPKRDPSRFAEKGAALAKSITASWDPPAAVVKEKARELAAAAGPPRPSEYVIPEREAHVFDRWLEEAAGGANVWRLKRERGPRYRAWAELAGYKEEDAPPLPDRARQVAMVEIIAEWQRLPRRWWRFRDPQKAGGRYGAVEIDRPGDWEDARGLLLLEALEQDPFPQLTEEERALAVPAHAPGEMSLGRAIERQVSVPRRQMPAHVEWESPFQAEFEEAGIG